VQPDSVQFVPVAAGSAAYPIRIPYILQFAGLHLFEQVAVLDSAAPGGVALTNAAELVIGIR
jgi:hypothetical protein